MPLCSKMACRRIPEKQNQYVHTQIRNLSPGAVPVRTENIDTDQIIPARFLKATQRKGIRRQPSSVTGATTPGGSGSPRSRSTTAVMGAKSSSQAATSGAAVRRGRSPTTGSASWCRASSPTSSATTPQQRLLPITVSGEFLAVVRGDRRRPCDAIHRRPGQPDADDLRHGPQREHFEIDAYKKRCLLNGYDDVDYLRSIAPQIEAFEQAHK